MYTGVLRRVDTRGGAVTVRGKFAYIDPKVKQTTERVKQTNKNGNGDYNGDTIN